MQRLSWSRSARLRGHQYGLPGAQGLPQSLSPDWCDHLLSLLCQPHEPQPVYWPLVQGRRHVLIKAGPEQKRVGKFPPFLSG